jgi:ubiquinone/menaquinone biosynthesis C-methylase UbiE
MKQPRKNSKFLITLKMALNDNINCLVDCWNALAQNSRIVSDDVQTTQWERWADGFVTDMDEEKNQKRVEEFFTLLEEVSFSPEGANVLDIGCGPGTLSIPLARAGADVTALDISAKMLDYLKETAQIEGLRINAVECSWWSADINKLGFRKKFDLVVASMTPGIRDIETFDRMMTCTRQFCYYRRFIGKGSMDRIRQEIFLKILCEEPDNPGPDILYPFMYLYLLGYRPLIRFNSSSRTYERNWAEEAEEVIRDLKCTHTISNNIEEKIREYYKNESPNGKYRSKTESCQGTMVWSVNTREGI